MNANGDLTVNDLPLRERVKAHLPATGALLALLALVLIAAFAYTNEVANNAQDKATRENARVLAISTARFQYATNRSVCGFRKLADSSLAAAKSLAARSEGALKDKGITPAARRRTLKALFAAEKQVSQIMEFKRNQVTVPFDYDCHQLPTKPPPNTLPPHPS